MSAEVVLGDKVITSDGVVVGGEDVLDGELFWVAESF